MTSTRARQPRIAAKPSGRIRTQGLTEGAILAALVAVLAVATHYVPLLGIATAYLCPLPLAILVIRHGFRVAALATVVSILAAITVAGPPLRLASRVWTFARLTVAAWMLIRTSPLWVPAARLL